MNSMRASLAVSVVTGLGAAIFALSSCGSGGDCDDGADNDGDGLIDGADPACAAGLDNEAPDPVIPECDDGLDNDGDDLVDTMDPGCATPDDDDEVNEPIAQCKDGVDNDGDGLKDFPEDPGCELSLDDDEMDSCPDGVDCPLCSNGEDDDGDGGTDYGNGEAFDSGCDSAADNDEFNSISGECGAAPIQMLPMDGIATGHLVAGGTNALTSPLCSGTGGERVYQFTIDEPRAAQFTTVFDETTLDTVLYLRSDCQDTDTELACNDDATTGEFGSSIVVPSLEAGTYFLVLDGRSNGSAGDYKLQASIYTSEGGACDPAANECPPGFFCQLATPAAGATTCEPARCGDTRDFDGDGENGFPTDPGCATASDNDEADDCFPTVGAMCPDCSDNADNDSDGQIDYPADTSCISAAGEAEILLCPDEPLPIADIAGPVTAGSNVNTGDNLEGSCGNSNDGNETVYRLTVPGNLTTLHLDTNGSTITDTTLYIRAGSCTAADLECDDDDSPMGLLSLIDRPNVPAGVYFVVVASYGPSTPTGNFTLNINGVIATGQTCNQAQITAGLFSCQGGGACATTCQAP